MSDFATLINDARAFYGALNANNNRDWWSQNKATYEDKLKAPALALLDDLTPKLAALADAPVVPKLFRPHRDVRFSKDKTPYNTHLHMMWEITGDARQNAVFFFGIGVDYVTTGVGMMEFEKAVLEDWRKFVDLDTKRVSGILEGLEKLDFRLSEPALKRVPTGFDPDHPAARLLRMKGLTVRGTVADTGDLPTALLDSFTALWPANALLIQIAES